MAEGTFSSDDTLAAFRQRSDATVESLPLPMGFDLLVNFYGECRVTNALPMGEGGDMLLFQWGTYNWGQGENFEINLTRQIIVPAIEENNSDGDDDPEIWQLRLTYYFPPEAPLRSLGSGNMWCESPDDLASFRKFVLSGDQVLLAAKHHVKTVELVWEDAE